MIHIVHFTVMLGVLFFTMAVVVPCLFINQLILVHSRLVGVGQSRGLSPIPIR